VILSASLILLNFKKKVNFLIKKLTISHRKNRLPQESKKARKQESKKARKQESKKARKQESKNRRIQE